MILGKLKSWGILLGLVVGSFVGYLLKIFESAPASEWIVKNIFDPVGTAFLYSLFMIVVPLVFSSLAVGVFNLGDTKTLKKMGIRVILFYLGTTFCAIIIGQFLINSFQPGVGLDQSVVEQAMVGMESKVSDLQKASSSFGESLWPDIVTVVIPKNILKEFGNTNMLAVIFVSMLFGVTMMYMRNREARDSLKNILEAISEITIQIVEWVMVLAPIAVGALMASAVFGFGLDIMGTVIKYLAVVLLGYTIHFFLVYGSIIKFIIKLSPEEFYRRASVIFMTAFSTSSSSGTMPVTMEVLQKEFGVPSKITSFTIPIGVTFNMDGTALFEVIAAIFVAQVFGIDITLTGQITLITLVLVTSIGVAGVPGGSIPILMAAMASMGIPPQGIALILGVDRLLDMGRTVVNVAGDTVATLFIAKKSGINIQEYFDNNPS